MTDDTEVELDTALCPRTTHRNITEFHDVVVVDKLLTRRFIYGSPDLSLSLIHI